MKVTTQARSRLLFVALAMVVAVGAIYLFFRDRSVVSPEIRKLVLQREWTANAEFAGDVWAASLAQNYQIALSIKEGAEAIDPVKEVRSGNAHFGVASADRIMQENESGAGLVVLATAAYQSPVVFLTQSKLGAMTLESLRGKTIGLQSGTNTELVFQALLRSKGIPIEDVNIVESGWGTSTFEDETLDVLGAFDYDEPVTLDIKGIKYGVVRPAEYGVRYIGTVYFARESFVRDNPVQVQAFMNALVEGWRSSLSDPDEAISKLSTVFPAVKESIEKERESFKRGTPYFSGEGGSILYASPERWTVMGEDLVKAGKLKSFDVSRSVDYRFLEKANKKK
jgi:NitT/TauT family transport system substrate-binding protein